MKMKKGQEKVQTDLNWVHLYLKDGNYPPGLTAIEKRIVRKRAEQFCLMDDGFYFLGTVKSKDIGQGPRKVLLTYEERWDAIHKAHVAQDGVHLGLERTLEPVTEKYYWVGIQKLARDYIRQCLVCRERNPRLGQGSQSSGTSVTDGSYYEDGSSIVGEDTLSLSGTEVVSTSGDVEAFYDQYAIFTRETAKSFWEMVDLRLYGPFKSSQKTTYILVALDGFSLWPEAFILDTVSPASIAQIILKLVSRYGIMGKLVMSQEDEVLEMAVLKALNILKQQGSIDLDLSKTVVDNTGGQYDEFDNLLEHFIATQPQSWADCIDYCLLPLRSSCLQNADYTPAFLAHSRELQLPSVLVQHTSAESQQTGPEGTVMIEPIMTKSQKTNILDMMIQINEAVKDSGTVAVTVEETFQTPATGKSVVKETQPLAASTPRAIVTRARSGTVKPKQFDDNDYITPGKRKATSSTQDTPIEKKVKVEVVGLGTGGMEKVGERSGKADETARQASDEEAEKIPSDSETDLSTVAQSGSKLTVDLDHFYKCIRQYLVNKTYLPNSSYKFKTLIREGSKQYKLVNNDLYYKSDSGKTDLKIITTKEDRLNMLEWAHIGLDKSHQGHEKMLQDLKDGQVHWKGKSLDCESFALACPDCDNCNKEIKLALKNMQEEKKLIGFDTCAVYDEIRMFLRPNIFPDAGKSLEGIKKYLNSFKIEGDQLTYVTDLKRKSVVISPAERMKLIAEAHLEGGRHQDVRYTLSKVFGNNFWFGMKIDIKVFVTYCCTVKDGKFLNDRYFMFRSYFMKKGSGEQIGRVIQVRCDGKEGQTDSGTEDHETVDMAGNIPNIPAVNDSGVNAGTEQPTGIFVSTSETQPTTVTQSRPNIRLSNIAVETNKPNEKGDAAFTEESISSTDREQSTVHIVSSNSKESYTVKLREPKRQSETGMQNVVVEMNEGGEAINIKLEKVLNSAKQHENMPAKDSDPVTMAAVKSILPHAASVAGNVLNEIEVGNEETSQTEISETIIEMRDSSVDTETNLVVNESVVLNEDSDDDDEDDDDDDDDDLEDTIDISTSQIHSELLSRLTETPTPATSDQSSGEKKAVTPRQHYKCNICGRVFYGPNKFKTHIYRHTGQKPFACSLCNKKYTNNKSLIIHERTHTGELPYLCNTCGKRMPSKVSLKSHLKTHDGKGGGMPCKCDICGRDFTRRHLMERHRNFKHINLQTEFTCTECPKVFGHQRSLKRHFMSTHMGVKNHVCSLCGKAFYRKEYLTSHQAQHAGLTVEMAKKKRQQLREVKRTSMHYVQEQEESQEEGRGEELRRIVLHQDEDGNLRVIDLETEHQVRKIIASQLGQSSHSGETMVVRIQESASPESHVIRIDEQGSEIKQQVIEIQQTDGSHMEQQVIEADTPVKETVVEVENDGQSAEVVEVPVEGESYVEYQTIEESSGNYITVGSQTNLPASYAYTYTSSSQADITSQGNQELIYDQPAVQYEVECVGDVGDEEALSAINLLAQASAAQYENVSSQI